MIAERMSEALQRIEEVFPDLVAVILFGSQASGEARPDSDVDLALLRPQRSDAKQVFDLAGELAGILGRDVDLIDLQSVSTVLRLQVLKHAQVLLDRDPAARLAFEARCLSEYGRFVEERRPILQAIRETGRIYAA